MTTLYFKILKGSDEPEYRKVVINKGKDTCDIVPISQDYFFLDPKYILITVSLGDWQKYAAISFIQGASAGFSHYAKHSQFKHKDRMVKNNRKLPDYAIIDELDGFGTATSSLEDRIADIQARRRLHNDKVDAISYY